MGFWDDIKDALGFDSDEEAPAPAPSSEPSKFYAGIDFGSLENTYGDIMSKIDALDAAFIEMYQREKATELWPDYEFIIRLSPDQTQRRSNENNTGIIGGISPQDLQTPHRRSSVLPFHVPADAGDADQQAVDSAARADAAAAIEEIRTAFQDVLNDGSLVAVDALLRNLAETATSAESLIDTHETSGFKQIRELFEGWEGSDADAGLEKYGNRLRPAAGFHHEIVLSLLSGAAAECGAKLITQMQLGAALDAVHQEIEELKTGTDIGLKVSVRTAFNQLPFSGALTSLADAVSEGLGGNDSMVSDWLSGFFEALEFTYEVGLTPQRGSSLKSGLLETAASVKEDLLAVRDDAKASLELDLGTWQGLYQSDPQVLVPGEKG